MDIKELRIGNFVHYKDFAKYDVVIGITEHDVTIENIISVDSEGVYKGTKEDIRPIPLTEDWLVRFGFVQSGNLETWWGRSGWNKGDFYLTHGYGTSTGSRTKYDKTEFDYVHSLQNLYFALTGEDLVVKE